MSDADTGPEDAPVEVDTRTTLTRRVNAVEASLNDLARSVTAQHAFLQKDIDSFTDAFGDELGGSDSGGITPASAAGGSDAGSDTGDEPDQDDPGFTGWADQADADQWAGLVQWVDWLSATYQLGDAGVRSCWPAHGAAVEELAGLKMAWENAIGACVEAEWVGAEALAYWHDRYLPGALGRLRTLHGMNACKRQHEQRGQPLVTDTTHVVIRSTGEVPDLAGRAP